MTRVEVETGAADLLASAFVGEDQQATVVLINRSTVPLTVKVEGLRHILTTVERTSATQPNLAKHFPDPVTAVNVAPGEIVTLTNVALGALPEELAEAVK